jgi:hypothetical protein
MGRVKRGKMGAEIRDVARISTNTTGNKSKFSWNRMIA